jgi:hypothetical protein
VEHPLHDKRPDWFGALIGSRPADRGIVEMAASCPKRPASDDGLLYRMTIRL